MFGKLIVEAGIIMATVVGNSPYGRENFQQPYLLVQRNVYDNFYFKAYQTSRTNAKTSEYAMNPKTALWTVASGYTSDSGITIEVGHQSEHNLNIPDKYTESYNYIELKIREEFF